MTDRKRRGRPSGYTPEVCNKLIALMSTGLSLTGAAAALGIGRTTAHRWMDAHEEFRDAVFRGQATRALWLERKLLETTSGAVVRFCCLALVNAAPEEWGKKRITNTAWPERRGTRLDQVGSGNYRGYRP